MTQPSVHRNDIRYLIFLILLVFIVSCFTGGCVSAPTESKYPAPSCREEPQDFRCKVYIPELEPIYDKSADTVSEEVLDEEF